MKLILHVTLWQCFEQFSVKNNNHTKKLKTKRSDDIKSVSYFISCYVVPGEPGEKGKSGDPGLNGKKWYIRAYMTWEYKVLVVNTCNIMSIPYFLCLEAMTFSPYFHSFKIFIMFLESPK